MPSSAALEAAPPPVLKPGTVAPGFSLPSLAGTSSISLASFRGKPVIVNFFASWCRDCRAELGAMATVARTAKGRVAVVGVDSNETSEAAATSLLAAAGATYPVAVDAHATVASEYLVSALPVSYFVRRRGTGRRCGARPPDRLVIAALDRPPRQRADDAAIRADGRDLAPPSVEAGSPPSAPPVDRAAALAEGAPGIPTKFVFWVLGFALVASLGGLLGRTRVFLRGAQSGAHNSSPRRARPDAGHHAERSRHRQPIAPSTLPWRHSWA